MFLVKIKRMRMHEGICCEEKYEQKKMLTVTRRERIAKRWKRKIESKRKGPYLSLRIKNLNDYSQNK